MSPAWFWLVIAVEVNVTWIGYDVWAKLNGHNTLSRQMHDWFYSPTIGPWIYAGIAFALVLAFTHFLRYHAH
jgi:hypothetical protein